MIFFSGGEIIEVAIQIERNGLYFYKTLANKIDEADIKELFNHMAGEEEKHIESFQSLYESFRDYKPEIADEAEYFDYIKMLADMNVFTKKEGIDNIVNKVKKKEDALDMAMSFEKDSIIFFAEIKDMVKATHKKAVDDLINQEKGHLKKLMSMKK
ncbi:MAG: ferritin family protein [Thermodesulfobacteriota bacterium]|nr:ferritin family protein [Thermodesulfobacteriota bacterium]